MSQNQSSFIVNILDKNFSYPDIPTMISEEEKKYLYFLGKEYWSGIGNIVEIGPWLGGSTYCLAAGFYENKHRTDQKIVVYDNFIWRPFMSHRAPLPLSNGDDFLPYFQDNLKEYKNILESFKASLPDERIEGDPDAELKRQLDHKEIKLIDYQDSHPVEILFIDGAKSWKGTVFMFNHFCDQFIPGKTLFVCQDYKYWGCYWIVIVIEFLFENLEIEHILPYNSVSFKLKGELSKELVQDIPDFENISAAEGVHLIRNAADRMRSLEGYSSYLIIRLNEIKFLAHKGQLKEAEIQLKRIIRKHPSNLSKQVFMPLIKWFNESYEKEVELKESFLFRALQFSKRMFKRLR